MNIFSITESFTRWLLLMQEFDIKFVDKLDRENVVAYFLCRLQVPDDPVAIDDNFPNENILSI